jgi:hypothetical protein
MRKTLTSSIDSESIFVNNFDVFNNALINPLSYSLPTALNSTQGYDREYDIWFNVNSLGYRSENFTKHHDGKHILFSGCSVTYGIGLEEEEIWSKKLFNKISKDEKLSGYFNLSQPGVGILEIVSGIYKYINSFGNPDCIFLNIPDIGRIYLYDNENDSFFCANFSFQNNDTKYKNDKKPRFILSKTFLIVCYQYLLALETYCKSNNIDLYYLNWSKEEKFSNNVDLKNLHIFKDTDMEYHVSEYLKQNQGDQNALYARDKKHFGTATHYAWSEMLYNVYKEKAGL